MTSSWPSPSKSPGSATETMADQPVPNGTRLPNPATVPPGQSQNEPSERCRAMTSDRPPPLTSRPAVESPPMPICRSVPARMMFSFAYRASPGQAVAAASRCPAMAGHASPS
jgi:hypothetical protein